jgi:putative nucleotidyltransferase with HDIG domain
MIPTKEQAYYLWDKYNLPGIKRTHVTFVAKTALFLADQLSLALSIPVRTDILLAAALLHDIDKMVPRLPGEQHPDTAVRILKDEGYPEVAALVVTHPLHAICNPHIAPTTWEEKILYLSDKMVKYDIITVDKRFDLWRAEDLPEKAKVELDAAYPKVKILESEIFSYIHMEPEKMSEFARKRIL